MKRSTLALVGIVASLTTVAAVRFGGWATVSVQSVPDYLVVGKATELTFSVRQHAVEPLIGLSPEIVATSARNEITVKARDIGSGRYRADVTVPATGDWRIVINSGFGKSRGELLPIRAYASAPATIAMTDADRGRVLFAAKACVTCHVHGGVDIKGEANDAGPDLTEKRFAAQYLAQFLNNPSIKPASDPRKGQMPRPDLRSADIPLLVAFINAERRTATK